MILPSVKWNSWNYLAQISSYFAHIWARCLERFDQTNCYPNSIARIKSSNSAYSRDYKKKCIRKCQVSSTDTDCTHNSIADDEVFCEASLWMKLRLFSISPVATLIVTFLFFWELRGMILRQEAGRIPMKMKNVSIAGFPPASGWFHSYFHSNQCIVRGLMQCKRHERVSSGPSTRKKVYFVNTFKHRLAKLQNLHIFERLANLNSIKNLSRA